MKRYCNLLYKSAWIFVVFCSCAFVLNILLQLEARTIRHDGTEQHREVDRQLMSVQQMVTGDIGVHEESLSAYTGKFWTDQFYETLYIYKRLLQAEHSFNKRHISAMRNETEVELGKSFNKLLFVDKENSPLGTKLHYYMMPKSYYNVSQSFFDHLPSGPANEKVKRCSVVGNSGSILNSTCGKDIDKADFVYRCNAAPLEPYIDDAGIKSNVTSFNPSIFTTRYSNLNKDGMRRFLRDMTQYHGYLWVACLSYNVFIKRCMQVMNKYNLTENSFVMGHPEHYKQVMKYWKKRKYTGRPSTGFYYTTDAIRRCDEVHLYGFWPFPMMVDTSLHNVSYHYFDKMQFSAKHHNMNEEFSILVQMHILGMIKLHVGKCT